jgi:CheY-like chemotaxis protein
VALLRALDATAVAHTTVLEASRQRLIAQIERKRQSRVILLVHRQEIMSSWTCCPSIRNDPAGSPPWNISRNLAVSAEPNPRGDELIHRID